MQKIFRNRGATPPVVILIVAAIAAIFYLAWTRYGAQLGLRPTPVSEEERKVTPEVGEEIPPLEEILPTPRGTPKPILQGKETYSISQASGARPRIVQAEIDPHDPKVGNTQTITVRVIDTAAVQSVRLTLESDNKTNNLNLSLVEGTNLDGRWQANWEVNDTVDFTYILTITATGVGGQSSVEIGIRRP